MVHSNKNRLFEVMGKLDSSFKPKLNEGGGIKENQYYDSDPSDGDIDADKDSRAKAEKLYDDGQAAFSKGDTGTANNLRQQALKVGSSLGWGDIDLPQYQTDDSSVHEEIDPTQGKTNFNMRGKNRANPKYTHFAVLKNNGKIINGWDYKGYDPAELRAEKKHYFFNDITDMQINPKLVNVVTTKYLQRQRIDPFDFNNWNKDNDVYTG
jgi:hypothetical protein